MRNEYVYAEEKVGRYTVKVLQDFDPFNPRTECDNLATMVCFHRRYDLGDKHNMSIEEAHEILKRKDIHWIPLYLYDHSGITISTGPFSCPWDSGQIGFIYLEKEVYKREWNRKRANKKHMEEIMRGEVENYDNYLTGEVYGYIVEDEEGDHIDSCWGFFGDKKYALSEGVESAKWAMKEDIKNHVKKVKEWIRNRVPLQNRSPLSIT